MVCKIDTSSDVHIRVRMTLKPVVLHSLVNGNNLVFRADCIRIREAVACTLSYVVRVFGLWMTLFPDFCNVISV